MNFMFYGNTALVDLDLSSFNAGNVKSMFGMFQNATSLVELDLSSFNPSSALTNMGSMFFNASSLSTINLRGWTVGSINSNDLFYGLPGSKVVYCTQNPTGNNLGVTCQP